MTKMFLKQTKSSTKLGLSLSISHKQYVQILTAFERLKFIDYLSFCGSLLVYIRIICLYLISTENTQTQTTNVQMIIIICIFVRLRLISTVSILKSTVTQTKKNKVLKQSFLSVVTLVDTFFFVLIIIWWKNRITNVEMDITGSILTMDVFIISAICSGSAIPAMPWRGIHRHLEYWSPQNDVEKLRHLRSQHAGKIIACDIATLRVCLRAFAENNQNK